MAVTVQVDVIAANVAVGLAAIYAMKQVLNELKIGPQVISTEHG